MDETSVKIKYADLSASIIAPKYVVNRLKDELSPFFKFDFASDAVSLFHLVVRQEPCAEPIATSYLRYEVATSVAVDTSLYKHLASNGKRWGSDLEFCVEIELYGTIIYFERKSNRISLFQQNAEYLAIDTIRTLKSLFTLSLERTGAIQVHSAAAVIDNKAVLLLGDMWQGKTTILLELLSKFKAGQLSCDTLVIRSNPNGVVASGWPSPFSASHGTILHHKELHHALPAERHHIGYSRLWTEGRKSVLTSKDIAEHLGTVIWPECSEISEILILRFSPQSPTEVSAPLNVDELRAALTSMYLGSRDPIYHNWHGFINVTKSEIDRNICQMADQLSSKCVVRYFTWAPSAESLLSTVPLLGQNHRSYGDIVKEI